MCHIVFGKEMELEITIAFESCRIVVIVQFWSQRVEVFG